MYFTRSNQIKEGLLHEKLMLVFREHFMVDLLLRSPRARWNEDQIQYKYNLNKYIIVGLF